MRRYSIVLCLLFLVYSNSAFAQDPIKWHASIIENRLVAGGKASVQLRANIEKSWHIYSLTQPAGGPFPTEIAAAENATFIIDGKPEQPAPETLFDQNFGIITEFFSESVTFTIPIKIKSDIQAGKNVLRFNVKYMLCNNTECLPPTTKTIEIPVTLKKAENQTKVTLPKIPELRQGTKPIDSLPLSPEPTLPKSFSSDPADQIESAKKNGLLSYLALAMSLGALSLLTPCVFPMIPITVSYFTKRREGNRGKGMIDALFYALGIIFTFTAVGFALALTIGATGVNQFAANPWVNLIIACVFVSFAANLLGAFEIAIPSTVLTKLSITSNRSGVIGVLLMGLTFTLTSFTCTVPFIGTVMVTASQGDWFWPLIGMIAFSTTFALPFFILALFPSLLVRLPKSGGWLNSVKVVMGFLELAAAMKFLSNIDLVWHLGILNREVFLIIWIVIALIAFLYLLGRFYLPNDTHIKHLGIFRIMWAIFFLAIAVFLCTGLIGTPLGELDAFLPPRSYSAAAAWFGKMKNENETAPKWIDDYEIGLQKAKAEHKNLFINFTGYACTNCRWMEANIFNREDVKAELNKFVLVRLYTDGDGKEYDINRSYEQYRFGTIALPFYVILSSNENEIARFPGLTRNVNDFLEFIKTADSNY